MIKDGFTGTKILSFGPRLRDPRKIFYDGFDEHGVRIMTIRRRAREIALQVLYQLDISSESTEEVLNNYWENFQPAEKVQEFCRRLVEGVRRDREKIDRLIEEYSQHWTLKRMGAVDRNILRLATFELLFCPDIPFKVTLNEAIELAKKFGTEDSGAFVNGMLDKIHSVLEDPAKKVSGTKGQVSD